MKLSSTFLTPSFRLNSFVVLLFAVTLMWSSLVLAAPAKQPFRGAFPWSVLLCTNGTPLPGDEEARLDRERYHDLFFGSGPDSAATYWRNVSYGQLNLEGVVHGWFVAESPYWINDCRNAAIAGGYTPPDHHRVAGIFSPEGGPVGGDGWVHLPHNFYIRHLYHELGHNFGSHAAASDSKGGNVSDTGDWWDIMGYGYAEYWPVGRNAHNTDVLGWIPRDRIFRFGSDGITSHTITLAPLYQPEQEGFMLIRIPFDPSDLNRYYTVEFRVKHGVDAGIPATAVLIHEVKKVGEHYRSFLLREGRDEDVRPIQTLNENGVSIRVDSILPGFAWGDAYSVARATVTVTTDIAVPYVYGPNTCKTGYVWREADERDWVCVRPWVRAMTLYDNSQAEARRNPNGGPYGPDTCLPGFVWREAYPNDHVCVTGDAWAQALEDNREASKRLKYK
jgi:hypothetical protein